MEQEIKLYSFTDADRSGKVRWTACELGYDIEELSLGFGEHRQPAYMALNPYSQIPTAIINGERLIESSAICITLAERHPEAALIPTDPVVRPRFWEYLNLSSTTLEQSVVNIILAQRGIADERWIELAEQSTRSKLQVFAGQLPASDYLAGRFSLADIFAAYVLRIGVQAKLVPYEGLLAAYMDRLRARPAAIKSRIFDTLQT